MKALVAALFCCLVLTGMLAWEHELAVEPAQAVEQSPQPTSQSDYVPPERDANVVPIAKAFLATDAEIIRNENYAAILKLPLQLNAADECRVDFANPAYNSVWLLMDLRLADNNVLLYRTGLIAPGEALTALALEADAAELLRQCGDTADVTLVVYSFDWDTYVSMGEMRLTVPMEFTP